jgi:hypothetical protein
MELKDSKNPPALVSLHNETGERVGIITIWYDNVIGAIWNNDHAGQLTRHLENASTTPNIKWKEVTSGARTS